jgi:hypothetical protein
MPDHHIAQQDYQGRRIAEVHDAVWMTIGNGLRQRMEVPQQLNPVIVSIQALITNPDEQ